MSDHPASSIPPELANHPDYSITRELGRGGMGVVYLAKNILMDRDEVLKVAHRSMLEKPGVADRFLQEIRLAAQLVHVNVVRAYSVIRIDDLLVFAMEYVPGLDLAKIVRDKGPLSVVEACGYAAQVANGLQHAFEKGLVHRDIKPSNLILSSAGKNKVVKILDFGLAKMTSEAGLDKELTGANKMLGTPDYIAPEQILDARKAGIRADIYSLGCTLYYLLKGAPPFAADSLYELLHAHNALDAPLLTSVRADVPPALAAIVAKMMAKSPADRFQTPKEVALALAPFTKPSAATAMPIAKPIVGQPIPPQAPNVHRPKSTPPTPAAFQFDPVEDSASTSRPSNYAKSHPTPLWKNPIVIASGAIGAIVACGLIVGAVLMNDTSESIKKVSPIVKRGPTDPGGKTVVLVPPVVDPVVAQPSPAPPAPPAPVAVVKLSNVKLVAAGAAETLVVRVDRPKWEKHGVRLVARADPNLVVEPPELKLAPGVVEGTFSVRADAAALPRRVAQIVVDVESDDAKSFRSTSTSEVAVEAPPILLTADATAPAMVAGDRREIAFKLDLGKYKGPVVVASAMPENHGLELNVVEGKVVVNSDRALAFGLVQISLVPRVGEVVVGKATTTQATIDPPPLKFKQAPGPRIFRAGETLRVDFDIDRGEYKGPISFTGKTPPDIRVGDSVRKDACEIAIAKDVKDKTCAISVRMRLGSTDVGEATTFDAKIWPAIFDGPFPYWKLPVHALAFSEDGREILTGRNEDQAAFLLDAATGVIKKAFLRPAGKFDPDFGVEFGKNFNELRTLSSRGGVIWNVDTGKETNLEDKQATVACAFSPDGQKLVSAHKNNALRIRSTRKDVDVYELKPKGIALVAFAVDDEKVLLGYEDGVLAVWNRKTKTDVSSRDSASRFIAFSPDRKKVFATPLARGLNEAWILDVETGNKSVTLKDPRFGGFAPPVVAFHGGGKWLLTGFSDGTVVLWNAETGASLNSFSLDEPITAVALSPDARNTIAATRSGKLVSRDSQRSFVVAPASMPAESVVPPTIAPVVAKNDAFRSAAGKFLAAFPGNPTTSNERVLPNGSRTMAEFTDVNGVTFKISCEFDPKYPLASTKADLDKIRASALASVGGRLLSENGLLHEGRHLSREIVFSTTVRTYRNRFFVANSRIYQILVIGAGAESVQSEAATKFINSMKSTN